MKSPWGGLRRQSYGNPRSFVERLFLSAEARDPGVSCSGFRV